MENKGRLIAIEGLDGSGKATQTEALYQYLLSKGKQTLKITFPDYESDSSALVKMYLAGQFGSSVEVNAYAAASFYSVDRYASYRTNWKQYYLDGFTILSDRYTTSNLIHQMGKLPPAQWDSFADWLFDYEYHKLSIPKPYVVLYLDMHPDVSMQLIEKRYAGDLSKKDIHEADTEHFIRSREAAMFAAKYDNWKIIPCSDEYQAFSIKHVTDEIIRQLEKEGFLTDDRI